jgi:hypothetical protein
MKETRIPRSLDGDERRFYLSFRKLTVFREAVKPRPVTGYRSHESTFFTLPLTSIQKTIMFFRELYQSIDHIRRSFFRLSFAIELSIEIGQQIHCTFSHHPEG